DGLHRFVLHCYNFAGVDHLDREGSRGRDAPQLSANQRLAPHEHDVNSVMPRRVNRALNFRLRGAVGTHRVQGYHAWHGEVRLAGFFYFENLASFIVTAFGADTVRKFALVAVRTLGERARSEEHTSELQSPYDLVCRLLLEKKKAQLQL